MHRFVLLALVAAAACSTAPDQDAVETPAPPAPAAAPTSIAPSAPAFACPNQESAVADTSLRAGEALTGDVDGDGDEESVSVHFDAAGAPGCQAFVVAESAGGTVSGPLETWRSDLGLPAPTLNTLQEVDGEPGLEVVVNMGAGASAQF
ncbi:MAG: hypothetical protein ABR613_04295, partial [Actinomycetota bacterium]